MPKVTFTGGGSLANQGKPSNPNQGPAGGNRGVPGLNVPTGRLRALPTSTGIRTPGLDAFEFGIGQAVDRAGDVLTKISSDQQRRADESEARSADSRLADSLRDLDSAYQQKKGKEAFNGYDDYEKAVEAAVRSASDGISSSGAKDILASSAERRRQQALGAGVNYRDRQLDVYEIGELEGQAEINGNDVKSFYTVRPEGLPEGTVLPHEAAEQRLIANITDLGRRRGLGSDAINANIAKAISDTRVDAILSKVETDPMLAEQLYKQAEKEGAFVNERVREQVFAQVDDKADTWEANETALEIQVQYDGLSDQLAAAKQIKDPEVRDKTLDRLVEMERITTYAQKQAQSDRQIELYDSVISGKIQRDEDLPRPSEVGADNYRALRRELHAIQSGATIVTDGNVDVMLADMRTNNQEQFKEMPIASMNGLSPASKKEWLAAQKADRAGTERQKRQDSKAVRDSMTAAQWAKKLTQSMENQGKGSSARGLRGVVHSELLTAFGEATAAKGQPLTFEERQSIYNKFAYPFMIDNMIFEDEAGILADVELKDRHGLRVPVLDIYKMVLDMKRQGIPVTDDTIEAEYKRRSK